MFILSFSPNEIGPFRVVSIVMFFNFVANTLMGEIFARQNFANFGQIREIKSYELSNFFHSRK